MWKRSTLAPVVALVVAGSLLASCARLASWSSSGQPSADQTRYAALEQDHQKLQQDHQRLRTEYRTLEQTHRKLGLDYQKLDDSLKKQAAANQDLEERLARLQLALLEKEAQIRLLTQKLDSAILEVVRAMAKLRSLESKAEAASNLAETEIALKMVETESAGRTNPDAVQAEKLLSVAGQEFKKENYGGALYLTTQAKSLLRSGPGRATGSENVSKVDGEVLFSLPLPLKVVTRGNVREGPGHNFKVAYAVPEGAPVIGHSYKGMWVRVRSDDGRWGWIFYSQVGQR